MLQELTPPSVEEMGREHARTRRENEKRCQNPMPTSSWKKRPALIQNLSNIYSKRVQNHPKTYPTPIKTRSRIVSHNEENRFVFVYCGAKLDVAFKRRKTVMFGLIVTAKLVSIYTMRKQCLFIGRILLLCACTMRIKWETHATINIICEPSPVNNFLIASRH